jgi:hypothetical protein
MSGENSGSTGEIDHGQVSWTLLRVGVFLALLSVPLVLTWAVTGACVSLQNRFFRSLDCEGLSLISVYALPIELLAMFLAGLAVWRSRRQRQLIRRSLWAVMLALSMVFLSLAAAIVL